MQPDKLQTISKAFFFGNKIEEDIQTNSLRLGRKRRAICGKNFVDLTRGTKAMPFSKWIRWNINLWLVVVTAAATIFAGVEMLLAAGPETKAPSSDMATAIPASLSPIPVPDLLAQPRSLKQFGVPLLQTLAEIPIDNPQTSERIALGRFSAVNQFRDALGSYCLDSHLLELQLA
jgi:hypothetical protein